MDEAKRYTNLAVGDMISGSLDEAINYNDIIAIYDTIKANDNYIISAPKDATCKTIILQSNDNHTLMLNIDKECKNKELLIDLI